jgi:hypothetical protein
VRLNPFDLPATHPGATARPDTLLRRALFAHTFIAVLLGGQPDPAGRAALARATTAAYTTAGITSDPRTWNRPAPLLGDLAAALRADAAFSGDPAAKALADRLVPFTEGSHAGLFDAPTTTRPESHLVAFSLRDLPDELRAAGTLLVLDHVWRKVTDPHDRRPRLIVVDEAWLLMREPEGARFLHRAAKSARKHWAALSVVTQDADDVLNSELGRSVVANAATQVLLRQAPQALDRITEAFGLSAGERELLAAARRGEGLLARGGDRIALTALASPFEHQAITTAPHELYTQPDRVGTTDAGAPTIRLPVTSESDAPAPNSAPGTAASAAPSTAPRTAPGTGALAIDLDADDPEGDLL